MPLRYATVVEFETRYPNTHVNSAAIADDLLPKGAMRLNMALAAQFTVPFSSNNLTAKDLSIDFAYLSLLERTKNAGDSAELREYLNSTIDDLRTGKAAMVTNSGEAIGLPLTLGEVWSANKDFEPVFSMLDPEDQRIDPDLEDDIKERMT